MSTNSSSASLSYKSIEADINNTAEVLTLPKKLTSVSIIFPAYNEQENIADSINNAITAFEKYFDKITVIPVNDGGADNTGNIIDEMAAKDERVKPVHHEVNQGYGTALRSGFKAATHDYIFFSDSDGQFDLEEISKLLLYIDSYDMVLGYREKRADPFHRKANAWAWGSLVRMLFKINVKDIDCAFKLFRRSVFNEITLESGGAMVNTELLALATKRGFTMKNVPVSHYSRELGEQTGANPLVIIKAFAELFKLYAKIS
ncbi:MAG: glycosyltransferase family 2 protein [Paraglaciecola sp.]|uniref:glycosyltransferase family 2 protein n=1 Tax=Paraglaciecola sp. TaxID=1920173 RepID=UPI003266862B